MTNPNQSDAGCKNDRLLYLDVVRILATLAVIVIHISSKWWYTSSTSEFDWAVYNVYDSFSRWAVPCFFMISGALFLNRDLQYKRVLRHNVFHLLIAFFFWSAVYTIVFGFDGKFSFVSKLLQGYIHMWFIPAIIAIYLAIPIFKAIAKDQRAIKTFLVLWIISDIAFRTLTQGIPRVLPVFADNQKYRVIATFLSQYKIVSVTGYAGFFLLGYYIHKQELSRKVRMAIYALGILAFIYTAGMTLFQSVRYGDAQDFFYNYISWNVLLEAIAVFVWAKNLKDAKEEKVKRIIAFVSDRAFGVYLVHFLFLDLFDAFYQRINTSVNPIAGVPVMTILTFLCSFVVISALRMIPKFGKIIT